jgi:hypothetical protein
MQPNIVSIDGSDYRIYTDENNVNFHGARIQHYALRRAFGMAVNTPKIIDFNDLQGWWQPESLYISSPEDSEVNVEILDSAGVPFYADKFLRNETPRIMPPVLLNNTLTMQLTAKRSQINLLLLYLKPAHLAYSKDF